MLNTCMIRTYKETKRNMMEDCSCKHFNSND